MKHKKLIISILVVLLLIDVGIAYSSYKAVQNPNYSLVAVKRGDIASIVSSTGTAKPAAQIDLQFTTSGRVADVKVKAGDEVKKGQVLMSQDSSDLSFQRQGAQAALQTAQAKLDQLIAGASAEDIAISQTAVANAQKSLDDAKASADNSLTSAYQNAQRVLSSSLQADQTSLQTNADTLDSGTLNINATAGDHQAVTDAKNLRTNAEANYTSAKTAADNATFLFNESNIDQALVTLQSALAITVNAIGRTYDALGSVSNSSSLTQTQLDAFKSNVSTARTSANTALTNLVSAQQTIAAQKVQNQTSLAAAQGALDSAQNALTLKLAKPRDTDIALYQAQVAQAQASLSQIVNQISQKSLSAPIDGVITNVAYEVGEIAGPSQAAVSMNSLSNFEIETDIAESDIAKIAIGDPVAITFDAFGDSQKWQGTVTKIDPAQTVIQGVVYYKTTVGLSSDDGQIKAGMTANLDIQTDKHENVLIIPLRAVTDNGSSKTVQILDGKNLKAIPIETGLKSDSGDIEVTSGLTEGQQIVIQTIQ